MSKTVRTTSIAELHRLISAGEQARIVDVRTRREFAHGHVAGAENIPLGSPELPRRVQELAAGGGAVFVICHSGGRSRLGCEAIIAAGGGGHAVSVEGGVAAWREAGHPVQRLAGARGMISIERQVRIAAGALVLTGCALGWWVHPGFFGVAAFVGAGLVFAGATDFCGMGLLLARMPWNR
jgi:rhodanese-related sulfurtransferase